MKFTLEIFTLDINKMALFKYFKVVIVLVTNISSVAVRSVLPNSSGSTNKPYHPHKLMFGINDLINDDTMLVVETIIDKGMAMWGTYESMVS